MILLKRHFAELTFSRFFRAFFALIFRLFAADLPVSFADHFWAGPGWEPVPAQG
jgi:hypothetical protein